MEYKDIPSIEAMFEAIPDDRRAARTLLNRETRDIAKLYGLPNSRNVRELELVTRIRSHITAPTEPQPCNCAGRGRRWEKADRLEPVTYAIDPGLLQIRSDADEIIAERLDYLASLTERLKFKLADRREVPDVIYSIYESDGRNGTLGVTLFYNDGTEDLDVFKNQRWSVMVGFDPAEDWSNRAFFETVTLHENLHMGGLDHIDIPGNVIRPFYGGPQYELGPEELAAWQNLYGAET